MSHFLLSIISLLSPDMAMMPSTAEPNPKYDDKKQFLISVQSSEKPLANWPKGQVERSIGISSNGCFAPNLRFFIGQKEYLSISSGISQIDIWRFNLTKIIWLFISVTFFCRGTISNFVRMIIIYCSVNTVAAIKFFKG